MLSTAEYSAWRAVTIPGSIPISALTGAVTPTPQYLKQFFELFKRLDFSPQSVLMLFSHICILESFIHKAQCTEEHAAGYEKLVLTYFHHVTLMAHLLLHILNKPAPVQYLAAT